MYIELFLLDNFIFDMLILRISSAISHMSFSYIAASLTCICMSVYSAFAMNVYILQSLPFKILLCTTASIPFFIKAKKICILPLASIFISTILAGGFVHMASSGSIKTAPSYIRLILYPAFVLFFVPPVIRHFQRLAVKRDIKAAVCLFYDGEMHHFDGIFDSGSQLCEPLSGLPVVLIYAPQLIQYANIPIKFSSAGCGAVNVKAFIPERLYVNGCPLHAYIAPTTDDPNMPALVPWVCKNFSCVNENKEVVQ